MKKIILAIVFFVQSTVVVAQNENYYKEKESIKTSTYTYNIDDWGSRYSIVSEEYSQLKKNWRYKNGEKIRFAHMNAGVELQDISVAYNVYREILSENEINKLKFLLTKDTITYENNKKTIRSKNVLCITNTCAISLDGRILAMKFGFPNISAFTSIHPDKFYALSQALKEKVRFKIPEQTKEYVNYVTNISFSIQIEDL